MLYIITRKFIDGTLAGITITQETAVDLSDFVGQVLGGGQLGSPYLLVSCVEKEED